MKAKARMNSFASLQARPFEHDAGSSPSGQKLRKRRHLSVTVLLLRLIGFSWRGPPIRSLFPPFVLPMRIPSPFDIAGLGVSTLPGSQHVVFPLRWVRAPECHSPVGSRGPSPCPRGPSIAPGVFLRRSLTRLIRPVPIKPKLLLPSNAHSLSNREDCSRRRSRATAGRPLCGSLHARLFISAASLHLSSP